MHFVRLENAGRGSSREKGEGRASGRERAKFSVGVSLDFPDISSRDLVAVLHGKTGFNSFTAKQRTSAAWRNGEAQSPLRL